MDWHSVAKCGIGVCLGMGLQCMMLRAQAPRVPPSTDPMHLREAWQQCEEELVQCVQRCPAEVVLWTIQSDSVQSSPMPR